MNITYQELAEVAEPLIKLMNKNSDILNISINREEIKLTLGENKVENITIAAEVE